VMFMTTGEDQERAQRQIHSLVQRRVDGLIIVPSFDYMPLLAKLEQTVRKLLSKVGVSVRAARDNQFGAIWSRGGR
jgi:DNA-binding LacI/PurR family transcriptional regulator